jgi:hypothetical protein
MPLVNLAAVVAAVCSEARVTIMPPPGEGKTTKTTARTTAATTATVATT